MKKLSPSIITYIALIIILAISAAVNVFLPQHVFLPTSLEQELPAPKPVIALVSASDRVSIAERSRASRSMGAGIP